VSDAVPHGSDQTRAFRKALSRIFAVSTIVSMLSAGILGALVTTSVGPYFVMGLAIYTGNTEPEPPSAPFPGLAMVLGAAVFGVGLWRARKEARGGWLLMELGAIAVGLTPFWHLARMFQAMMQ